MIERWKRQVEQLKGETYAIYLAYKDPGVQVLIAFVVVHTLSPMDLIPDFIPVLGYLDDLIIAPLGIALALKVIPEDVMDESRRRAQAIVGQDKPNSRVAAAVVAIWLLVAALIFAVLWRAIGD